MLFNKATGGETLCLHVRIIGAATTLRWNPGDVLVGIFDVASFAVDAVLRVDHKAGRTPLLDPFVDPGWAIARRGPAIDVMLGRLLQRQIGHLEMWRLVLLVVCVGEEHRREPVEGELAIWLGIGDRHTPGSWPQCGPVRLAVLERTKD